MLELTGQRRLASQMVTAINKAIRSGPLDIPAVLEALGKRVHVAHEEPCRVGVCREMI